MRRMIGIGLAAMLLAISAVATFAGGEASGWGGIDPNQTNVFKGEVEGGGKFYFEARYKHGDPIKMGYVLALMVPVECAEGSAKASFGNEALPLRIPVRKRGFTLDEGEIQKAELGQISERQPFVGELTGRLDKDGRHGAGTLEFGSVDLTDEDHGCSTDGTRDWEVKLTTKFSPHG